jgi:hypothetical protein
MELKKLKVKLFTKNLTYEDVSRVLKISVPTFSNKINGKNEFTLSEVTKLSIYLNLSKEEKEEIFFNQQLEFNSCL